MSLAIAAQGLDVGYSSLRGPVKVIAGLDLEVETGTFLSILGPSGCGKSTLLRVVADLLEAARRYDQRAWRRAPHAVRSRRDVGFVFQDSPRCCPGAPYATMSVCRLAIWDKAA